MHDHLRKHPEESRSAIDRRPHGVPRRQLLQMRGADVAGACVSVMAGDAQFEDCGFSSGRNAAVLVSGDATPRFERCSVLRCGGCSVLVEDRAAPAFAECAVCHGAGYGIVVRDAAAGSVEDSDLSHNVKAAVVSLDQATTSFACNDVHHGGQVLPARRCARTRRAI